MSVGENLSLVIPAFNEESRFRSVVEAGLEAFPYVRHVIFVDDGSTDGTLKAAESYTGVHILGHDQNRGKGEALQYGYELAKDLGSTTLAFLDADLNDIQPEHIISLIQPVTGREASMTIGILDRTLLQKMLLRRWGGFSGQRALPIEAWENLAPRDKRGFNVEAALNARARKNGTHRYIQRVDLAGVTHTGQREKEPDLAHAALSYTRRYGSAVATYARIELEPVGELLKQVLSTY